MSRWPKVDWCFAVMKGVSRDEPRDHLHCERCGERMVTVLPMRATTYVEVLRGFSNAHRDCSPVVRSFPEPDTERPT